MNAKLRHLAKGIALLILLTSVHSASAFYDPHIGQWVNRDPIGEDGGANIYGFVQNDSINYSDSFGLIKYNIQVFDTGLQTTDEEGIYTGGATVDYTAFSMPPSKFCKLGVGSRYDTLDITVNVAVYYREAAAKKRRMYSGKTVEQHENSHAEIYKQKWANTENLINNYGKLCFCSTRCQMLRDDLLKKGPEDWSAWADAQQALVDYNDYEPSLKSKPKSAYDSALSVWRAIDAEFRKIKQQFDKDCK